MSLLSGASFLVSTSLPSGNLCWISNYMTSRTRHVVEEGEILAAANVLSGVPQGSVLAYTTSIIIIQVTFDLSRMILEQMNSGLPIIFLLSIHQIYTLISRKKNPTLPACLFILNNCKLQMLIFVSTLVFCCQKIYPGNHIYMHAICSKARNILGFLYRKFYNCSNTDTLKQLYISFCSQMEYTC